MGVYSKVVPKVQLLFTMCPAHVQNRPISFYY